MVCSAQTEQLSCIKISTISKQNEMRFHLSLVTREYHWVHRKQLLILWYVLRKPCTYLAPTLTLSPNRPKRDSTWPMPPRSIIRCVRNDFQANDTFGANWATILHQESHYLQMDRNELPLEPHHQVVPSGASKMTFELMVRLAQTYLAPTLTLSLNTPKRDSSWSTSPRSSIGCVQNDFKPIVRSVQTVQLSCVKINTISKWTKSSFQLSTITNKVPSGASKIIYEPMVRLAQTMHLSCTDTNTISKRTKTRFHMTHVA
jgi:hypothetical protein